MIRRTLIPAAAVLAAATLTATATATAAGRVQTLRVYEQQTSITLTRADGTVLTRAPLPQPRAGDRLDITYRGFRGNHAAHSRRWTSTTHLTCLFGRGEPDCVSHVALGGSMLVFRGNPGTLTTGTGRYEGATGRVLSNTSVGENDLDVVARVRLRP